VGGKTASTAYHFDGAKWEPTAMRQNLHAVWGADPQHVWAAGAQIEQPSDSCMFLWNGTSWSTVFPPVGNVITGLWGSAADDVWATWRGTSISHWDGTKWSLMELSGSWGINAVHGFGAKDVWAVGQRGQAYHWDGQTWTQSQTGMADPDRLLAVWGSTTNDLWAVGRMVIAHWDGSAWTVKNADAELNGIWGQHASSIWAVGSGGTILHWDGHAWTQEASGATATLNAVWGTIKGGLWVAGDYGTLLHHDL